MSASAAVSIIHDYSSLPCPEAAIRKLVSRIYREQKKRPAARVNCIFCSDYTIKKLNNRHRGRNRPTDVLAFPFHENDFLGEIYVSLQRAAVQARRFGASYHHEVLRLTAHGLLHLLGFDHKTEKQQQRMNSLEERYSCTNEKL